MLIDTITLESICFPESICQPSELLCITLQNRADNLLKQRETDNEWTFDAIVCRHFNNINETKIFFSSDITQLLRKRFQRERRGAVEICRGRRRQSCCHLKNSCAISLLLLPKNNPDVVLSFSSHYITIMSNNIHWQRYRRNVSLYVYFWFL
jgi:hypothetical protein